MRGLPHPILNVGWVKPSSPGWGYPHQVLTRGVPWGTPFSDLGWEYPLVSRMGYPLFGPGMGYSPSRPGMRNPLSAGWGTPTPIQTWDGVSPIWTWDGVPPANVNRLKILPSLILQMRAVRKALNLCGLSN